MILKEPDYQAAINAICKVLDAGAQGNARDQLVRQRAGLQAEKNMAYQLRAFFGDHPGLKVINDLKIEHKGVTAQIDHLVFSRRAIYFIESKSVSDTLTVNQHGEWFRVWGRQRTPIHSPVEQSKRHAQVLMQFLEANISQFMGKLLGLLQKHAGTYSVFHRVAISSTGRIEGPGRNQFSEIVYKYDQIATSILDHHKKTDKGILWPLTSKNEEEFNTLWPKEVEALGQLLLARDLAVEPLKQLEPLIRTAVATISPAASPRKSAAATRLTAPPAREGAKPAVTLRPPSPPGIPAVTQPNAARPTEPAGKSDRPACRRCGSEAIDVAHGPYGYYIKCQTCGKNTPIRFACPTCGRDGRIRKDGSTFYRTCQACGDQGVYFTNSNTTAAPAPPAPATAAPEGHGVRSAADTPNTCPICGALMVLRKGKRGGHKDDLFWGCSMFPRCRTILPAN